MTYACIRRWGTRLRISAYAKRVRLRCILIAVWLSHRGQINVLVMSMYTADHTCLQLAHFTNAAIHLTGPKFLGLHSEVRIIKGPNRFRSGPCSMRGPPTSFTGASEFSAVLFRDLSCSLSRFGSPIQVLTTMTGYSTCPLDILIPLPRWTYAPLLFVGFRKTKLHAGMCPARSLGEFLCEVR